MRAEVISLGLSSAGTVECAGGASGLEEYLSELGLELGSITYIRPRERELEESLMQAMGRSHLVIITAGRAGAALPSLVTGRDDLARKILSKLLDRRLILQGDLLKKIEDGYKSRCQETPNGYEKMALLPHGSRAVEDPQGLSAGFYLEHGGRYILYLPGLNAALKDFVPFELAEKLAKRRRARRWERSRTIRSYGLDEHKVAELIKGVGGKQVKAALSESIEGVDICVKVSGDTRENAEKLLDEACLEIKDSLGDYCYGEDRQKMENTVARLLTEKKMRIATAESCTGGLIAKLLTDVPGSSVYMERGVVTYSNEAKVELLDVPAGTIEKAGAVSTETAQAMAEGIRWSSKADIGLSVTGIAGPAGGTVSKPVGLVYIGLSTPDGVSVKGFNFPGDRAAIRHATAQKALDIVRRYLIS